MFIPLLFVREIFQSSSVSCFHEQSKGELHVHVCGKHSFTLFATLVVDPPIVYNNTLYTLVVVFIIRRV